MAPSNFFSAFLSCFVTIVASEFADKTFFIAAVLAMKQSRLQVFLGCFSALFLMNSLTAGLGALAPTLIPVEWTYVASILLFTLTGLYSLKESFSSDEGESELVEVEKACHGVAPSSKKSSKDGWLMVHPIAVKAFALTFLAEWGDKSQFVTLGLGATQDLLGVVFGGGAGHALCTSLAVMGGKKLALYFNERAISALHGVLFLTFAVVAVASGWEFSQAFPGLSAALETQAESSPRSFTDAATTKLRKESSQLLRSLPMDSADSLLRCAATRPGSSERTKRGSKKTVAAGRQELPICYDFVQGKCRRLNCRYQHDFGAVIRHNARESRVCFDHLRGECTRGSLCRFSHDIRRLVLQGMEEAAYHSTSEPTANGICYDFCRGACPRRGKCPWTHNLVEIAWNTAKQPLLDTEKIHICREVVTVMRNSCPRDLADPAIELMISQPSLRLKILSLHVSEGSHAFAGLGLAAPRSSYLPYLQLSAESEDA